jgi:hypothetical protein
MPATHPVIDASTETADGLYRSLARNRRHLFRERNTGKMRLFFEQSELLQYPFVKRRTLFS